MEPNNNRNNNIPKTIPKSNPKDGINLDLSLGTGPQEQDPVVENMGTGPQELDLVEENGKFMQLLTSVSHPPPNAQPNSPPPPHLMIPHGHYNNVINPWNHVSGAPLVPSPQPGAALPPSPSPYLAPGQLLQPPQAIQGAAGAMETPRPGTRLGRPPIGRHARRNSSGAAATAERNVDDKNIVPPYPWATTRPAQIHNLEYLCSKNIDVISGQVHCRPCENTQTLEYNLRQKFDELSRYIYDNKDQLRQRAPKLWSSPKLTPCRSCQNGMKPVIGENKEEINWLFLLLGQMLGCCTMNQLRYFCDKNSQHRTGAKDRVVYTTYLGLCRQLMPCDLFNL